MTIGDAISILKKYNKWRTGEDDRTMDEAGIEPKEITKAIDGLIKYYEKERAK